MWLALDVCCGSRMMWMNKRDPRAIFCDIRNWEGDLCDGRPIEVKPDVQADFRALPFPDEMFYQVVFDPPHLLHAGEKSWLKAKYGTLPGDWKTDLRAGFLECFRVLKPGGTLIFKWSEVQIPLDKVAELAYHTCLCLGIHPASEPVRIGVRL